MWWSIQHFGKEHQVPQLSDTVKQAPSGMQFKADLNLNLQRPEHLDLQSTCISYPQSKTPIVIINTGPKG